MRTGYRSRRLSPIIIIHRRVGGLVRAWVSCARVVGTGDGCTRPAVRPVFNVFYHGAHTHTHVHAHTTVSWKRPAFHRFKDACSSNRGCARGSSLNHGRPCAVLPSPVVGVAPVVTGLLGAGPSHTWAHPSFCNTRPPRRGRIDLCGEFRDEIRIPSVFRRTRFLFCYCNMHYATLHVYTISDLHTLNRVYIELIDLYVTPLCHNGSTSKHYYWDFEWK